MRACAERVTFWGHAHYTFYCSLAVCTERNISTTTSSDESEPASGFPEYAIYVIIGGLALLVILSIGAFIIHHRYVFINVMNRPTYTTTTEVDDTT